MLPSFKFSMFNGQHHHCPSPLHYQIPCHCIHRGSLLCRPLHHLQTLNTFTNIKDLPTLKDLSSRPSMNYIKIILVDILSVEFFFIFWTNRQWPPWSASAWKLLVLIASFGDTESLSKSMSAFPNRTSTNVYSTPIGYSISSSKFFSATSILDSLALSCFNSKKSVILDLPAFALD